MQSARRSQPLIQRAKHHRENSVEGLVEPANRISKSPGMLGDGGGDPGVRQLKQQGAAGAKEDSRLAVDPPGQRSGTEDSLIWAGRRRANRVETAFKIISGQQRHFLRLRGRDGAILVFTADLRPRRGGAANLPDHRRRGTHRIPQLVRAIAAAQKTYAQRPSPFVAEASRLLGLAAPDRLTHLEPLELRVIEIERLVVAGLVMRRPERL